MSRSLTQIVGQTNKITGEMKNSRDGIQERNKRLREYIIVHIIVYTVHSEHTAILVCTTNAVS